MDSVSRAKQELLALLGLTQPTPQQLRRLAELAESLYDNEAARLWWEKAARAGDQDAADYLAVLDDERAADGHGEGEM